jgi:CBS domain-containing protein
MSEDIPGEGVIAPEHADPSSPHMDRRTTLKDALSMLLDQDVQSGIVVDRRGQLRGLLTIEAVMTWMRAERTRAAEAADQEAAGRTEAGA